MRKALVAGNWKMHGKINKNIELIAGLKPVASDLKEVVDILVCPPVVYLAQVAELKQGSELLLGAQDVSQFSEEGAHTGDCSASMLADIGASFVLVGHSERRGEHGESDELVARKVLAALSSGLTVILCIGETQAERERNDVSEVLSRQLASALKGLSQADLARVVVAYEPVWAIGTGVTASPSQAQDAHAFIRACIAELFGLDIANSLRIVYGGSVKATNASELFAQPDVDGGLIGGASLLIDEFTAICRAAAVGS